MQVESRNTIKRLALLIALVGVVGGGCGVGTQESKLRTQREAKSEATTESADLRIWRTSDGKQVGRAEVIDAKYDRKSEATLIYLKTRDGATLRIPFDELDKEGREFAWYGVQLRRAKEGGRLFALTLPGTVKLIAAPLSPVDAEDVPDTFLRKGNGVLLGIDARTNAVGRPPEGWCGEVAIQEVLLYYGAYYPQSQINGAGSPVHPDLYSNEIPVALKNLGMEIEQWPRYAVDLGDFLDWLREKIAAGVPVLTGVKVYPTKSEWSLDHFVLAVGLESDSLILNTTWGYRYIRTERQLRSRQEGFSFANKYNRYYGISINGWRQLHEDFRPVRLFVQKETADQMAVIMKCEDLEPGVKYSLYKLSSPEQQSPKPQITFEAKRPVHAFHDTISSNTPAIYRCRKVADAASKGGNRSLTHESEQEKP